LRLCPTMGGLRASR